jgi:hypothetical protein
LIKGIKLHRRLECAPNSAFLIVSDFVGPLERVSPSQSLPGAKTLSHSIDRKVKDRVLNYRKQMKINQTKLREMKLKKSVFRHFEQHIQEDKKLFN